MGNIQDYIEWRGDLTFDRSPWNDIDALLLGLLSYVNLKGAAPAPGEAAMTLAQVSEKFFSLHSEEELAGDTSFVKDIPLVMKQAAAAERYKDLKVCCFYENINEEYALQFSATTFILPDQAIYVSFRGTDDYIVGWKEDFMLACGVIGAQQCAAIYLDDIAAGFPESGIYVGGHSKGGNLAMYAASYCRDDVFGRIRTVYDFDGPGFRPDMIRDPKLSRAAARAHRIIPEGSRIGTLLEHNTDPLFVKSTNKGLMEHDALSWQMTGRYYQTAEKLADDAESFREVLKDWIDSIPDEKRPAYIRDLFDVIEASGCKTLSEFHGLNLDMIKAMYKRLEVLDQDSREFTQKLVKAMAKKIAGDLNPFKLSAYTGDWPDEIPESASAAASGQEN